MHLISILKQHYEISEDWTGSKYIGITFDWDYHHKQVHLSMPRYVEKALQRFEHERPRRLQNSPHQHITPTYGAKTQYVEPDTPSTPLKKEGQKYIQAVTRTLLYYSRAVDPTMLVALNAIAMQQASPTQKTMERIKQLLDYCASQEEAILTYLEWLLYSEQQGQFKIYWRTGNSNLADYFTKHHPPSHHRNVRGDFLMHVAELQRLRLQQPTKEIGQAMTDRILFLKFSVHMLQLAQPENSQPEYLNSWDFQHTRNAGSLIQ